MKAGPAAVTWKIRAFLALRGGVVGMFVLALLGGIFLPVYTDEIGWRFQERAAFDGVDKLYSEVCGPTTLAVPPIFMMPVRHYSAFFNSAFADPFYVRLSGVGYALLWTVLLLLLIRRLAGDAAQRAVLGIIGLGLMALGVLPLLMVWSRPEQPVVLAATAALLTALADWRDPSVETAPRRAWLRSIAIFVLAVIAVSYHLKGIFLFPVFLACLFFCSRGRASVLPRGVAAVAIAAITGLAASYWADRLACPGDPIMAKVYAAHSVGVAIAGAKDWNTVSAAVGQLLGNLDLLEYFGFPAPRNHPMSDWLEAGQISLAHSFVWFQALVGIWILASVWGFLCLAIALRRSWRTRRLEPAFVLALALAATVLGWTAMQLIRNVYDATFILPLTAMAIVLSLAAHGGKGRMQAPVNVTAVILGLAAIASPMAIGAIYAPSLARANAQQGYIAAQPHSVTVFGYPRVKPDIMGAARLCRMPDPSQTRAVMIDDLTYFAFMKTRLPQHDLGVTGFWRGEITDPMVYLRSRGSSGIIIACRDMPQNLRSRAKRQGDICCLGPDDMAAVP